MEQPLPGKAQFHRGPSRRDLLKSTACGFGSLALSAMASQAAPVVAPRAKRVMFLFMQGGPSQVDTYDYKPELFQAHGKEVEFHVPRSRKRENKQVMKPLWDFKQYGQCGRWSSSLFPEVAQHVDDLCFIHSMHTEGVAHGPATLFLHTGATNLIRPSMGAWVSYGLGAENENLPAFVALCPGLPVVGPQLWSSAFLPGQHQGIEVNTNHTEVENLISNIRHPNLNNTAQRKQLALVQALNARHIDSRPGDAALETHIRSMELAFQMQSEASEAFDLSLESKQTRESYGDSEYGRSCLLGRRLLERGVRVVQVFYVSKGQKQPWDTHKNNNQSHRTLCADADRGTAALLHDLKNRGMLDDTLVIWGGEFGRTPYAQVYKSKDKRKAGRDHHHTGFSMFLAGGGIRGGVTHGSTDDFGMHAVENRVHVHDLHATILHQMGIDHKRLTFRYSGRDYRLTDVHGRIVHNLIA